MTAYVIWVVKLKLYSVLSAKKKSLKSKPKMYTIVIKNYYPLWKQQLKKVSVFDFFLLESINYLNA